MKYELSSKLELLSGELNIWFFYASHLFDKLSCQQMHLLPMSGERSSEVHYAVNLKPV